MRIVVADDAAIVRAGLSRLLSAQGHEIVAETDRASSLPEIVTATEPDVVITDIRMPPTFTDEGLVAASAIREQHPDVSVLVLSQYVAIPYVSWLLERSPARIGYLIKDRILDATALDDALERLSAGETVLDPELTEQLLRHRSATVRVALSVREQEVLRLMAEGRSDRGIATQLFISPNTVGTHVQHIFDKLGIPDGTVDNRRVHAVLRWLHGL